MSDTYTGSEFEYDEIDEREDDEAWAELMCSLHSDGQCGAAGSEYCEFECPFRNEKA